MRKFLLATALLTSIFAAPANAQRVIVAAEPSTPDGTYCNITYFAGAANATSTNTNANCALFVRAISMFSSNTNTMAPMLSAGLNPSGTNAGFTPTIVTYAGTSSVANISASAVIKASAGRLFRVNVNVAGVAGAIHDTTTTGGATAANLIATIPAVVGTYEFNWPMSSGIVYIVGAGQVIAVNYN